LPKLPAVKPKVIIKILKKAGFIHVRSKGSHFQFKKGNLLVTIHFHNKELKTETFRSILRQAKMSIEEFNKFL